jgi:CheY-like chemotaxis protein
MRKAIAREFGDQKPRAFVLDDSARARIMTARHLRNRGFDVVECKSAGEFLAKWMPGTADVVVADWHLSATDRGQEVLEKIRRRDWDVPFVLVSGRLDEDADNRAEVLARLLGAGGARFVRRGENGIANACDQAEELLERRDLALLKVILSFRPAALAGKEILTSSGKRSVASMLEKIVTQPSTSHEAEYPITESWDARRRRDAP